MWFFQVEGIPAVEVAGEGLEGEGVAMGELFEEVGELFNSVHRFPVR